MKVSRVGDKFLAILKIMSITVVLRGGRDRDHYFEPISVNHTLLHLSLRMTVLRSEEDPAPRQASSTRRKGYREPTFRLKYLLAHVSRAVNPHTVVVQIEPPESSAISPSQQ